MNILGRLYFEEISNFFSLFLLMSFIIGCKQPNEQPNVQQEEQPIEEQVETDNAEEMVLRAQQFIVRMSNEEFEAATEHFDETMLVQLPITELARLWEAIENQLGPFIDQEFERIQHVDGYDVVSITGVFDETNVVFNLTFDDEYQIAGFSINE